MQYMQSQKIPKVLKTKVKKSISKHQEKYLSKTYFRFILQQ